MLEIWLLWGGLIAVVAYYGLRATTDTRYIFAPPLILGIVVAYIYIKSYFDFDELARATLMDVDYYVTALVFTLLSLVAFAVFFELGVRSSHHRPRGSRSVDAWSSNAIGLYVVIVAVIGIGAQVAVASYSGGLTEFYSKSHGSAAKYDEISAYLYALPYFLWTALIVGTATLFKRGFRSALLIGATAIVFAALAANTFLFGNRDGIIRIGLTLGGAYVFVFRPSLLRSFPMIGTMVAAVIAISVVGQLRGNLHLGAETGVAAGLAEQMADPNRAKYGMGETGHELVFNVAVIQAVSKAGVYSFGASYIFPFINFVPRAWWPSKPLSTDFGVNPFDLVQTVLGWRPIGGAAINSITETFVAFSWFGCLVTGVFAFACGRVFAKAHRDPTIMNIAMLVAAQVACVYWASQSFPAVFFQWLYTVVPLFGLAFVAEHLAGGTAVRGVPSAPVRRPAPPRSR